MQPQSNGTELEGPFISLERGLTWRDHDFFANAHRNPYINQNVTCMCYLSVSACGKRHVALSTNPLLKSPKKADFLNLRLRLLPGQVDMLNVIDSRSFLRHQVAKDALIFKAIVEPKTQLLIQACVWYHSYVKPATFSRTAKYRRRPFVHMLIATVMQFVSLCSGLNSKSSFAVAGSTQNFSI